MNVILVDFCVFDIFGEIIVFIVIMIGIIVLLKFKFNNKKV